MNIEDLEWNYLESTKIFRIAFHNNELYVEFLKQPSGFHLYKKIYVYEDVPEKIYNDILNKKCFDKNNNSSYGASLYQLVQLNNKYEFHIIEYL